MFTSDPPEITHDTVLGCPECNFLCCSMNQMCRHMCETLHGLVKCPLCDTYIVGRAFRASINKILKTNKAKEIKAAVSGPAPSTVSSTDAFLHTRSPILEIDVVSHSHLALYPDIRINEKDAFKRPGKPEDYGLEPVKKTDATSLRHAAFTHENAQSSSVMKQDNGYNVSKMTFRCMSCYFCYDTWTKMTKHLEHTTHTLPRCAQCNRLFICFGPWRPNKHEEITDHLGFWGVFNNKKNYLLENQGLSHYNIRNKFTGFCVLQYTCVCGITFTHPVHLAEHMRTVHHLECIADEAECKTCNVRLSLRDMIQHLRTPVEKKQEPNTIEEGEVEKTISTPNTPQETSDFPSNEHDTECGGEIFSASPFLTHRPLIQPIEQTISGSTSEGKSGKEPFYIVVYQCWECFYLFTSWKRMVNHIMDTKHCLSYCVECKGYLKPMHNASKMSKKTNLLTHFEHIQRHKNIIGPPVMPDSLEVLIDASEGSVPGMFDPPRGRTSLSPYNDNAIIFCYQCPGHKVNCYEVFLYYGDLVEHLIATGHGRHPENSELLEAAMPMVTYRAKFTVSQLVKHFNFVKCTFCKRPFPQNRLQVHEAICKQCTLPPLENEVQ
ncbi:unnamed protein product [Phytomonas sp. Hart1]|nr:unnamed protein product [Phytomonas sp. Hart1]|eukprot:CCW68763.1 unnamed protein product [Phytomonas sp. isolate Hart1]